MASLLQGHALYTRQAGSTVPCPYVDYDKGFNAVFARAYGLEDGETIAKLFGKDWGEHTSYSSPAICQVLGVVSIWHAIYVEGSITKYPAPVNISE